ncbi:hypothetical protein ACVWZA_003267 [Sphingomonas sp. UYAg733]
MALSPRNIVMPQIGRRRPVTIALMLLLQAATLPESTQPQDTRVDLPLRVRRPCEVSPDIDEIVVCDRRHDDQFRLKPIPLPAGMKTPIDGPGVDFDIGKAHGNVYTTTGARADGLPDKRIMLTVTMPF